MTEIATLPAPEAAADLSFIDPRREIGARIAVLARQMRQRFDERIDQTGVTRARWGLIAAVARDPGRTQHEIAAKLEMSDVTAGRLIDRVSEDGFIERRVDPNDRRARRIFSTAAAQPLLAKLSAAAEDYEREVFACMDDSELATMNALLSKLSSHISVEKRAADPKHPANY